MNSFTKVFIIILGLFFATTGHAEITGGTLQRTSSVQHQQANQKPSKFTDGDKEDKDDKKKRARNSSGKSI